MTTFCQLDEMFQVQLTADQARAIAKRLPSGFSVILSRQSKRDLKKVQQDITSDEEPKVIKKPPPQQQKLEINEEIKRCQTLLQKLKKHSSAAPFLRKIENVNYPHEIEYVDLSIIETNLKNNVYQTSSQFWGDVKKIWQMSYTMNNKGTHIYAMTQEIEQYFNELFKEIDKPTQNQKPIQESQIKAEKSQQIKKNPINTAYNTNKKPIKQPSIMEQPMNMQEKRTLVTNINSLPAEHLRGVWEIVSDGLKIQDQSDELEFDIDTLPVKKTRQLERYVNTKLEYLKKQQRKVEEQKIPSKTDQIVNQANTTYNYAPLPTVQQQGERENVSNSSFSSDAEEDSN